MADLFVCVVSAVAAFFVGKYEKLVRDRVVGFFKK